ncbi:AGO14 [Symbiodinium natans]|uniref:AGO14 protein n=1 Tax=Symbiodinium natans TaxID=878477 RepID=A0A812MH96_9DINO|nr:AGO14 [Symbiodinium natans]
MRDALRGELGLKRKVKAEYGKVKVSNKVVYGVSDKPANRQEFDCEEMGGKVNVVQYFKHKHGIDVWYPDLPCIQLGSARNCIPMEFVTVLGGEHNLAVGKLRPEFQVEVTRRTAMPPSQRRDQIMTALNNPQLGPASALNSKGITMELQMIKLNGRLLDTPKMRDGNTGNSYMGTSTNYSNNFKAISPPQFEVAWGMWCFTTGSQIQERDIWWLAGEFKKRCYAKGMNFTEAKTVEWPQKAFDAYYRCWKNRESFSNTLGNVLREELTQLLAKHKDLKLLVILLEDSEAITDQLYKLIKLITETEMGSFTTQFVNCKKGIADAEKKLNNLMLKVTPKVPAKAGIPRAAFNVALAEPHWLLKKEEGTMIMGADVTHNVAGISVAGVVASVDSSFASYFHEIRGQSPYTLNTLKQRNRQSEERIIDLTSMAQNMLQKWRKMNGRLPNNIIYYRDGVSDGQFVNVLQRELNLLDAAFKNVEATYEPRLVIIVGQKRHQTRLWMADDKGKGGGKDKGKGKKDPAQVRPGTVASDNIAQPSHMNFFLVSQEGIQGTSVPCHYHILHLDKRLVQRGIKVDDFEIITFQLCHLYSRADKSVGYATPAYMADHVCERGKHYLEAYFGHSDVMSTLGTSSSEERKESEMREEIEKRISWLNERAAASGGTRLEERDTTSATRVKDLPSARILGHFSSSPFVFPSIYCSAADDGKEMQRPYPAAQDLQQKLKGALEQKNVDAVKRALDAAENHGGADQALLQQAKDWMKAGHSLATGGQLENCTALGWVTLRVLNPNLQLIQEEDGRQDAEARPKNA